MIKQAIVVWSNLIVHLHTANDELDLTILGGSKSGLNLGDGRFFKVERRRRLSRERRHSEGRSGDGGDAHDG